MHSPTTISGKPFFYDSILDGVLGDLDDAVGESWASKELSPELLLGMYRQAKVDELYHSNRIEGNSLSFGESVDVVQANKEIRDKPFRDQQEARNLSRVLDYVYRLGGDTSVSVTQNELRRIHSLLLERIQADAGSYRTTPTVITGSKILPPEAFEVPRHMTQLSDFVKHATDPEQRLDHSPIFGATAAHVWLAQIHPFTDGNGRTARALMNLILMRRGYPPCIITEEDRPRYMDALEGSWENGDLTLLMELVYENVNAHRENQNWLRSVQARLEQVVPAEMETEYHIWLNAMSYLKSLFRHTIDNLVATNVHDRLQLRFIDYGELALAKYVALRKGTPVRKTSCFGIEVTTADKRQLYTFSFGVANTALRRRAQVVLMLKLNINPSADTFLLNHDAPTAKSDDYQLGFDTNARNFIEFAGGHSIREQTPQAFMRYFFEELLPRGLHL